MKNRTENRLHAVEAALLLALAVTAMWGAWSLQRQDALAEKTVRLHVIAHSDDPADQELKLLVRDRVLTMTEDVLRAGESTEQAMSALRRALPQLRQAAEEALRGAGCDLPVTALLENAEFPCKSYDGFALPAGEYPALRLVIGEGRGQNWWCGFRRHSGVRWLERRRRGAGAAGKRALPAAVSLHRAVGGAAGAAGQKVRAARRRTDGDGKAGVPVFFAAADRRKFTIERPVNG